MCRYSGCLGNRVWIGLLPGRTGGPGQAVQTEVDKNFARYAPISPGYAQVLEIMNIENQGVGRKILMAHHKKMS
jgi:hypothetical protein